MKTAILIGLLATGVSSLCEAQEARYKISGGCYSISLNSDRYQATPFGRLTGKSNFDCENAYDNLAKLCEQAAQKAGKPSGVVYKDLRISTKAYSSSDSGEKTDSNSNTRYGPFAIVGRKRTSATGSKWKKDMSTEAAYEYIEVDLEKDCRTNPNVPKDKVSSIQDSNLGG